LKRPRARLIVPEIPPPGSRVRLSREETAHARARRLKEGDAVILFDGSGREASARVVRVLRAAVEVEVERVRASPAPARDLSLLVAAIRPERLSWLVEKATELGTSRIVLVETARTQSFRARTGLVERLGRVARAAAKQSEQRVWPEVTGPIALREALAFEPSVSRFFLHFGGRDRLDEQPLTRAAVLVGPEGGWTEEETQAASGHGWRSARLPAGTLRTETAAIAALVLLRAAMEKT
jgi:16S rRNA (uracil1498-N3)-methyltransferase